ncbi:hypothetical protein VTN31DRAFT_5780 [Thermomyces dupontii]|uniref:uncharacterized protein n=1 Tax=Talaromyces thermophilus TaxID=28565 RepID=UPI0037449A17
MSEADYLPYQINTRTKDIIGLSKEPSRFSFRQTVGEPGNGRTYPTIQIQPASTEYSVLVLSTVRQSERSWH